MDIGHAESWDADRSVRPARDLDEVNQQLAALADQLGVLEEERKLLIRYQNAPQKDSFVECLALEREDAEFDLQRSGLMFGGRQGLSLGSVRRQRRRGWGTSISRTSEAPAKLDYRICAIDKLFPHLASVRAQRGEGDGLGSRRREVDDSPEVSLLPMAQ